MTSDALDAEIVVFVCDLSAWETWGMLPCGDCGRLGYGGCDCTYTPPDYWTPDASAREVRRMLRDCGLVEYRDPIELYEGEDREDGPMLTMALDLLDAWAWGDFEGADDVE